MQWLSAYPANNCNKTEVYQIRCEYISIPGWIDGQKPVLQ